VGIPSPRCYKRQSRNSDELTEFRALGGVVFAYNPLNRYTSRTVAHGYSRFRRLEQWNPDIVCTSGHPPSIFEMENSTDSKMPIAVLECSSYKGTLIGLSAVKPTATHCERFIARPAIICVFGRQCGAIAEQLTSSLPITILPNPIRTRFRAAHYPGLSIQTNCDLQQLVVTKTFT